jgi:hypothetical protein
MDAVRSRCGPTTSKQLAGATTTGPAPSAAAATLLAAEAASAASPLSAGTSGVRRCASSWLAAAPAALPLLPRRPAGSHLPRKLPPPPLRLGAACPAACAPAAARAAAAVAVAAAAGGASASPCCCCCGCEVAAVSGWPAAGGPPPLPAAAAVSATAVCGQAACCGCGGSWWSDRSIHSADAASSLCRNCSVAMYVSRPCSTCGAVAATCAQGHGRPGDVGRTAAWTPACTQAGVVGARTCAVQQPRHARALAHLAAASSCASPVHPTWALPHPEGAAASSLRPWTRLGAGPHHTRARACDCGG